MESQFAAEIKKRSLTPAFLPAAFERFESVRFERGQFGWYCTIGYMLETPEQFTGVYVESTGGAPGNPLSLITFVRSIWSAWSVVRQDCESHGAKAGERAAKGWA